MRTIAAFLIAALAALPLAPRVHAGPACVAQGAPAAGQVVPCAVQTPAGQPVYVYGYGGASGGSLASVLAQEIAAGAITRAQAAQSWDNTPAAITGGAANPFR